ncbi:hypothetical protein G9A89_010686 [Geosiphon pyriformis]|nr:hypothetical protein G9A89_010686 [Geosiphon pyriformis]
MSFVEETVFNSKTTKKNFTISLFEEDLRPRTASGKEKGQYSQFDREEREESGSEPDRDDFFSDEQKDVEHEETYSLSEEDEELKEQVFSRKYDKKDKKILGNESSKASHEDTDETIIEVDSDNEERGITEKTDKGNKKEEKQKNKKDKKKTDPLAPIISKYLRHSETPLSKKNLEKIKNKRLKRTLERTENKFNEAATQAARSELLLTEEAGYLKADGLEKTYSFTQEKLKEHIDINSAAKIFNLNLPTFGPYALDYTRNGRHMLIGGQKGHIATFDWQIGHLSCEFHVKETVRDVKWLHNEQFFAVAQKKYVYIYDHSGLEVHRLKKHIEINKLEFLPYHFLLASVGNSGWLHYQDTSTGKFVAEMKTKLGKCEVMCQNPWNAIIHLGHSNGTVTLWSPNMSTPLVKMLTHKGPVTSLAIDQSGKYMATSGLDGQLKLWDIRQYKLLNSYFTPTPASCLSISQLGLLAVGWGPHISIWKDSFLTKQQSPYMTHLQPATQVKDLHFCPFEDVLGFGHSQGISSLVIPGSGEPNFDTLENNPFQTKKQRQEAEVHSLLDKIQPEMITLDPNIIGKMDRTPQELREKEREMEEQSQNISKPRNKARGKNSSLKRYLRKKSKNVIDETKVRLQEQIAREKQEREKRARGYSDDKPPTALDRFDRGKDVPKSLLEFAKFQVKQEYLDSIQLRITFVTN